MSLEDLDSNFQSDESDYQAEVNLSDEGKDDSGVLGYMDLLILHNNLMCFENIYINNALIDMEEDEAWPSYDLSSLSSELELIQDHLSSLGSGLDLIHNYISSMSEEMFGPGSTTSPPVPVQEDIPSPEAGDSSPCYFHDFVQLYEEVASSFASLVSSSSSSASSSSSSSSASSPSSSSSASSSSSSSSASSSSSSSSASSSSSTSTASWSSSTSTASTSSSSSSSAATDAVGGQMTNADDEQRPRWSCRKPFLRL